MRIRDSARRHGIADEDIRHAVEHAIASGPVETNIDQVDGVLHIGPDRSGRMLEVVTIESWLGGEMAIHAMKLRKVSEKHLPWRGRP